MAVTSYNHNNNNKRHRNQQDNITNEKSCFYNSHHSTQKPKRVSPIYLFLEPFNFLKKVKNSKKKINKLSEDQKREVAVGYIRTQMKK